ncbi:MAG: indolepyruvate ferredoxin oxidoreductase subunit alpha [Oscillospiraceae bacterium]|jgi:indolepyruvate ferredoxin oxidoreductase alpha subunit|nr:indolepyruvate ferredoxin oxidoreductase subunit alpha [Oscillospiraceae bacterium]
MNDKVLMLGNEAIARGAYEACCTVSSAYPGTPSTEISENIVKYKEIYAEWAPNEKVAAEVAIGASISGARALLSMKHVGVNVAADPLFTAAYTGVNGGLVLVAADDPGMYSSQNEQDSRMVARSANIPVLEPSDSGEAKEFTKFAFKLSEEYDTPVMVRTTTRLAHSQSLVVLNEREDIKTKEYIKNPSKYVMMPGAAKLRHPIVEKRMLSLSAVGGELAVNRVDNADSEDKSIGFVTSGIPYQYVKEVFPHAPVLKLGLVHPLPVEYIRDFAKTVGKLYVIEELEPLIEEQLKASGIDCIGKEILTIQGEYSAAMLKTAILGEAKPAKPLSDSIPARPPLLCPGCPHRSVFSVLNKLKKHAAGDIGCYTLGAVPPLAVIDTTICMGSSISTLHGMEKARGREYIKDWVAVIGDSTFLHTGINSLLGSVYNKSNGTVIILDNRTTGMTGHQDHAATGKNLAGEESPSVNLTAICTALGATTVTEVNSFDLETLEQIIKRECAGDGVSVVIAKAPCVLLKGNVYPDIVIPVKAKCVKCGACLRPGCPALTKNAEGLIEIDREGCNGCQLCKKLCKFDALEVQPRTSKVGE